MRLTFDNHESGEDLTDFPVFVRLVDGDIDLNALHNRGDDLRLIDADGSGPLAHELAFLDRSALELWVRVPHIPAGSIDDFIWLYFDNPQASSVEHPTGVWSDGSFAGVWHLDQEPTSAGAVIDSLGVKHGTPQGDMDQADLVDGPLTGAIDFDGVDDAIGVGALQSDAWDAVTMEGWFYSRGNHERRIVCKAEDIYATDHVFCTRVDTDAVRVRLVTDGNGAAGTDPSEDVLSQPVVVEQRWTYTATTWSAVEAGISIYVDGELSNSGARDGDSLRDSDTHVYIGNVNSFADRYWNGQLDEVRVSSTRRSADWIRAQHRSMSGAFVQVGAPEPRP